MNFKELQIKKYDFKGKQLDEWQQCDDVEIRVSENGPRPSGSYKYYDIVVKGSDGNAVADCSFMCGENDPAPTSGTHNLACQVTPHFKDSSKMQYRFKVPKEKGSYGGGGNSYKKSPEEQAIISRGNACNASAFAAATFVQNKQQWRELVEEQFVYITTGNWPRATETSGGAVGSRPPQQDNNNTTMSDDVPF